jgi:hypothetical protein
MNLVWNKSDTELTPFDSILPCWGIESSVFTVPIDTGESQSPL